MKIQISLGMLAFTVLEMMLLSVTLFGFEMTDNSIPDILMLSAMCICNVVLISVILLGAFLLYLKEPEKW